MRRATLLRGAVALLLGMMAWGCDSTLQPVSRIVVVTFDTTRADRLGCYGYEGGSTPNLDALAAESVLFENAESQIPTTLPSHSTMFTGLYPQDHGVRRNLIFRLGPESATLAERLSVGGYATAAFPATFILSERFGLDQGFDEYAEPPGPGSGADEGRGEGEGEGHGIYRRAEKGVDLALDWIGEHADEPFFVWLHFYDPHAPYRPPFPYSNRFRDRPYDGELAYADAQFGRLMEQLRADPRWDETLVVVAGDHGEGLHQHGERYHSFLLYETTQRVPFIVRAPGARARGVSESVALADLAPTVLDIAGIEPLPQPIRGRSLRRALEGGELERRDIYFETLCGALNYGWQELRGIRYGPWKLIDSQSPELYNLDDDPGETLNLAAVEQERVEEMRAVLAEMAEPLEEETTAVEAHDPVMDPQTEALLASLGYVGSSAGGSSGIDAPHPRDVIDMASEVLAAQILITQQRWTEVEELADYVLQRDPGNKWALSRKISALISTERAREAQDVAAEYVRQYPSNARAYELLARTYKAQEKIDQAYEVLQHGLEAVPGNPTLVYLSLVAAFDLNSSTVCSGELPAALAEDPESPRLLVLRARCEARAGETDLAFATLALSVKHGFREVERLREAEDFAAVVEHPKFEQLVSAIELASRVEF